MPPILQQEYANARQAMAAQSVQDALSQQMAHQLAQAQQNAYHHGVGAQNVQPPLPDYHGIARELFMRRMSGVRNSFVLKKQDFIHCQVLDDMVYVFFLLDGKEGVVKEQVDSFPSDQLIAQFRLIMT
jgi:hypothetical protein